MPKKETLSELREELGEYTYSSALYQIYAFLGPITVQQMICCCYFIERAGMAFSIYNSKQFFFDFQIDQENKQITIDGFEEFIATLPGVRISEDGRIFVEPLLLHLHGTCILPQFISALTDIVDDKVVEIDEENPGHLFDYAVNHDVSDYEKGYLNTSEMK